MLHSAYRKRKMSKYHSTVILGPILINNPFYPFYGDTTPVKENMSNAVVIEKAFLVLLKNINTPTVIPKLITKSKQGLIYHKCTDCKQNNSTLKILGYTVRKYKRNFVCIADEVPHSVINFETSYLNN